MTGPQRRSYTAMLRDSYTCRTEWGGCGASPGAPCLTANGKHTQPHEARWEAHRQRPADAQRGLASLTDAELMDRHARLMNRAAELLAQAQALLDQVTAERQARAR